MTRQRRLSCLYWLSFLCVLVVTFPLGCTSPRSTSTERLVYVGTYTSGESKGIYLCRFNTESGELTPVDCVAETPNPSFLALHPDGGVLYATNEMQGDNNPTVTAYTIDRKTGDLTFLNQHPAGGGLPCHIVVDPTGKNVLVANYGGATVALFRLEDDGSLGARTVVRHTGSSVHQRQETPHPHGVTLDAANRFLFVPDLGIDQVVAYRFDAEAGTLSPLDNSPTVAAGAGPRHFTFHPKGRHAYVLNEMNCTITAFRYDATNGSLAEMQVVTTIPDDFTGKRSTAEIEILPSGKFLYSSNRVHNTIAVFAIDDATGMLTFVEHEPTGGSMPRNFKIDPTGKFLLAGNRVTNNIVVFRIDPATGELEPTGKSASLPSPVCLTFLPPDTTEAK